MTGALDPRITNMVGPGALPRDNGELVFAAPWEGRALAMAISLVRELGLEWDDFRVQLMSAISADPDRPYYDSWTAALEALVVSHEIADAEDLRHRAEMVVPPA